MPCWQHGLCTRSHLGWFHRQCQLSRPWKHIKTSTEHGGAPARAVVTRRVEVLIQFHHRDTWKWMGDHLGCRRRRCRCRIPSPFPSGDRPVGSPFPARSEVLGLRRVEPPRHSRASLRSTWQVGDFIGDESGWVWSQYTCDDDMEVHVVQVLARSGAGWLPSTQTERTQVYKSNFIKI